jgi:threonine dehydrogenase-like Zn-dependent dehydrogenase
MLGQPTAPSHVYKLAAPRTLRLESSDLPIDALADNELICRTLYSAISPGTELAAYSGMAPLRQSASPYPRLIGYMNVAEVEQAGKVSSRAFPPGTVVYTHAAHSSRYKIGDGEVLSTLPAGLAAEVAAPAYLYRLAWSALRRGGMQSGMAVAVMGLGAIGLAVVQFARHLGAACIAISDFGEARARAEQCGARTLDRKQASQEAAAKTGRDGGIADLVVSTTGGWEDWQICLGLARFNGVISVLGFPGRGGAAPEENPLASQFFYDRQLSIVAAGFGPERAHENAEILANRKSDMARILGWIDAGDLDARLLVNRVALASKLPEILDEMANRRHGSGTVVLDWDDFEGRVR